MDVYAVFKIVGHIVVVEQERERGVRCVRLRIKERKSILGYVEWLGGVSSWVQLG